MDIKNIINKKRLKKELSDEEIKFVISGFMDGKIKDYQMSALLMAITINDMTDDEVLSLTKYMLDSGKKIDLSTFTLPCVDKHSSGGIGDKTTLIIAPIVSSLGVIVPKMSGRGLGYTGGTIDKLESIPGFKVKLTEKQFFRELSKLNMAVVSQTEDIAIADKKIYALRDVTATSASVPLIASSIMSKKLALGSSKIVIDLKVGEGALINNLNDGRRLANLMIKIGKAYNKEVVCLLTNMDVPLGYNIGNSLEIEEVIDVLQNKSNSNLRDLSISLASLMVSLGKGISLENAKDLVVDTLDSGKAYKKFLDFVSYQKGDLSLLRKAKYSYQVKSPINGFVTEIKALELGMVSFMLGSGRTNKEDTLDYEAGIILNKQINDYVSTNEVLATLYSNKEIPHLEDKVLEAFSITSKKCDYNLILELIK